MSKLVTSAATYGTTENGALTYVTSNSKLLDLFSIGGALRTRTENEIINLVNESYKEDPKRTIATLLYLRDIRGGQGEKRTFRVAINSLKNNLNISELIKAIVEVGSWKDVFEIFTLEEYGPSVKEIFKKEESNSNLLFKWCPSIGGSSNRKAEELANYLGMSPRQYRKRLSSERAKLKLVETNMCKNNWSEINYEQVPSKAGLLYKEAFNRHDSERYSKFIADANKADGTVKINTGTLAPYELTEKYMKYNSKFDPTIEAMWKNLKNYCDDSNSIVVADTSGSMIGRPMAIASSLAIYFAERNKGIFHNEFITFSTSPKFIQFKDGMSLKDRVKQMIDLSIIDNTDIQAVFKLILKTAVDNHIKEEEMPKNIIICSDMEFDEAQNTYRWQDSDTPKTNFEAIKEKYSESGYRMPNIVFWNVDSRQNNVPVKQDESGVILVSGSSASTFEMIISGDIDPYKFMLTVIDRPRYKELAEKIIV